MALNSHTLPSLLLHQWMSSSIIMHSFIVLLFCQCMNSLVYREKIFLPPPPSVSLSLSLFLFFHIFKCQLYLCGLPALWSFDVFSSSVSGLCARVWELISKCSFRCFFLCSSKSKIKEVKVALPLLLEPFISLDFSLQLFTFRCKCSPKTGISPCVD